MDTTTISLLLCQLITLLLLVISELLPLTSYPYSGIVQAMMQAILDKQEQEKQMAMNSLNHPQ